VTQVNSLAGQIAGLNQQISNINAINPDPGPLIDQRNSLIQQLSGLIDVQVIPTDYGVTLATSNGTTLVSGSQSFALTTESVGTVHDIFSGGKDITTSLTGGSLAGLIQIRDREIPSINGTLDQLAAGLATNLNTANAQGFDLNGNAGGNLFVPPPANGVGAAATLTVNITDPALIAASSDGTSGSNGNLTALSAVATTALASGDTPINTYSNLVGEIGTTTSNTSADSDSSALILQQLQDQNGSVSGVSLDEEAANLIQYQNTYQAAARVVSTVNLLLLDAVNIGLDSPEE